jgi:glycosyltransferase 2 family protein
MNRPRLMLALKLTVLAGIVFFIARSGKLAGLATAFRAADEGFIAIAVGLAAVMLIIRAWKWQRLLARVDGQLSFGSAWRSLVGGMTLGLATPGRLGELGRASFLPEGTRLPAGALFVLDRVSDLSAIALAALVGTAGLVSGTAEWWLVGLFLVFFGGMIALPRLVPALIERFNMPGKLAGPVSRLAQGLKLVRARDVAFNFFLSCSLTALDVVSLYVLALAFQQVPFSAIAFAFPWILLTNLVPVTPGGIGVREGAAVLLLHRYGVADTTAINATLLLFIFNTLTPGLIGLMYVFGGRRANA